MTRKTIRLTLCAFASALMVFPSAAQSKKEKFIDAQFKIAEQHLTNQTDNYPEAIPSRYPRTTKNGKIVATNLRDWTEGFFPGCLWYIYEANKEQKWEELALKWTLPMEKLQYLKSHHDIGFLMYCSYGNAYRLTKNEAYKDILVQSAKSLCTRFSETTGCIKSWNYRESWDKKHKWFYPVIIDNMMNLELLYFASEVTGDPTYADIATKHADTTMKNQFRDDYSNYHVVNYVPETGEVEHRGTCQGYADNSAWSRGQAWAIYGYTMVYRMTKDEKYLDFAMKLADYWLEHDNLPKDMVPYWDFNAGQPGYTAAEWINGRTLDAVVPRDASAAAVTCSALFELATFKGGKKYYKPAVKTLKSLASDAYTAPLNTNCNFILKHSVGTIPHNNEIDVPLVYADYYYLEALHRYEASLKK